jgi:hypothetical protein
MQVQVEISDEDCNMIEAIDWKFQTRAFTDNLLNFIDGTIPAQFNPRKEAKMRRFEVLGLIEMKNNCYHLTETARSLANNWRATRCRAL